MRVLICWVMLCFSWVYLGVEMICGIRLSGNGCFWFDSENVMFWLMNVCFSVLVWVLSLDVFDGVSLV